MSAKKTSHTPQSMKHRVHRHVKKTLVPHKENQFRPLLIRRYGLLAMLLLMLGLHLAYGYDTTTGVLGRHAEISTHELLVETNAQRKANDAPSLDRSATLDIAAAMKAEHMLQNQYWAHTAPDGTEPWHWLNEAGYSYAVAGENLARNFGSAQATVRAWMQSKEHRENLLDQRYRDVGFAVRTGSMNDEPITLVVALYGAPQDEAVAGIGVTAPIIAPMGGSVAPIARLGIALQAMNPALLASLVLSAFMAMIALMAHSYRAQLPKNLRASWYRNHGVIKAGFMTIVLITTLYLYGGGQL